MPEKFVYQPALVECVGPDHHRFTTEEDVKQKAQYIQRQTVFVGFSFPPGSLDNVRCPECRHQVEPVTDERGFAVRPP